MKFWTQMNLAQVVILLIFAIWTLADWYVNRETTDLFWMGGFLILTWINLQAIRLRKKLDEQEMRSRVAWPPGLTAAEDALRRGR